HRNYSAVCRRLLQLENDRFEVAEQLQAGRQAATDRDVSVQVVDARVAARDRAKLRRQASFDRHSLDSKGGRASKKRWRFQHLDRQFSGGIPVKITFSTETLAQGCGWSVDVSKGFWWRSLTRF